MLFTEPAFLFCFLPVLIGLYFAAPKVARNLLLLAASLLFYAKGGGDFTYLLIASVVFNYTMAIWIHRLKPTRAARPLLAIAVGSNLVVLAIFKYATFGAETLNGGARIDAVSPTTPSRTSCCRSASRSSPSTRSRTSSTSTAETRTRRRARSRRRSICSCSRN